MSLNHPTVEETVAMARTLARRLNDDLEDEGITASDLLDALATEGITLALDRSDKAHRAYMYEVDPTR